MKSIVKVMRVLAAGIVIAFAGAATAEQFAAMLKADMAKSAKLIKDANVKLEWPRRFRNSVQRVQLTLT